MEGGEPDQSTLTGQAAGTPRVPWSTVAVAGAVAPGARVSGASRRSESVWALVWTETQSGWGPKGARRAAACSAGSTSSTPTIDQPVKPPSSAGAAGFFPELPLTR
ncbi:hypothetical protein ACFQ60_08990 [Streptomyces zhihengii]